MVENRKREATFIVVRETRYKWTEETHFLGVHEWANKDIKPIKEWRAFEEDATPMDFMKASRQLSNLLIYGGKHFKYSIKPFPH